MNLRESILNEYIEGEIQDTRNTIKKFLDQRVVDLIEKGYVLSGSSYFEDREKLIAMSCDEVSNLPFDVGSKWREYYCRAKRLKWTRPNN